MFIANDPRAIDRAKQDSTGPAKLLEKAPIYAEGYHGSPLKQLSSRYNIVVYLKPQIQAVNYPLDSILSLCGPSPL